MTLVRIGDAAEITGLRESQIRSRIRRGDIPHVRFGPRLVLFERDALVSWVREHRVATHADGR